VAANWKDYLCRLGRPDRSAESGGPQYLAVGLGNPGKPYEGTRHNVGFDVIDRLASALGVEVKKKKFGALLGEAQVQGRTLLLAKPQEFMNRSGQAVAAAMGYYRLPADRLLVITDDAALDPGRLRLRPKGSAGGHNGLADIINKLKSQDFARLRIGIGPSGGGELAEYVLSRPSAEEREILDRAIETAYQAVICWAAEGLEAAMNRYNTKESSGPAQNAMETGQT
jgi:PTH1 family peptidyl-tRNA hydrolase